VSNALLVGLAAVSLSFAPAPFPKAADSKVDLRKIQGEWEDITPGWGWGVDGRKVLIEGDRIVMFRSDDVPGNCMVIRLDATRRPKAIDLKTANEGRGYVGVYRLRDGTLTINYRWGVTEADRPSSIDDPEPEFAPWGEIRVFKRRSR
jgi:uncharacterized protein (TIGR03067 family)